MNLDFLLSPMTHSNLTNIKGTVLGLCNFCPQTTLPNILEWKPPYDMENLQHDFPQTPSEQKSLNFNYY
jgi:hypothetical protein